MLWVLLFVCLFGFALQVFCSVGISLNEHALAEEPKSTEAKNMSKHVETSELPNNSRAGSNLTTV